MATKSEIDERIDFHTKRVIELGYNPKKAAVKRVAESLLKYWENQLIKYKKENESNKKPT